jgi:hypothetical protein
LPPLLIYLIYLHSIFAFYCHACLLLPCMPFTVMHTFYYHACLLLLCMPSITMHASHCHAYFLLPCMPLTTMHVRIFRHWQFFFYAMSTVLLRYPFLSLPLTTVYLPLPCMPPTAMHAFHYHACLSLPCMPPAAMHARTVPTFRIGLNVTSMSVNNITPRY